MGALRIAGLTLLVAGALALLYGSFGYTRETHRAQIGDLQLTTRDHETVNVPAWVGVVAMVTGGLMLGARAWKR